MVSTNRLHIGSSNVFLPANVCFQVDETVAKILLKSSALTEINKNFCIITGRQKSVRCGETTPVL